MRKARAIVYEGPRKISVKEYPMPSISSRDMLIEVEIAGVDGTEVKMFKGELDNFNVLAPIVLGDEVVGRVVKIGQEAAKKHKVVKGDRVTVEARWPCNDCFYCLYEKNYYLCNRDWPGNAFGWISSSISPSLWGAYSTHMFVHIDALVYKVPEQLPPHIAILAVSVLANAIRWVKRVNVNIGDIVLIMGPGPQGLMCSMIAKESGASKVITIGLEKDAERLAIAKKMGSDSTLSINSSDATKRFKNVSDGRLADIVIETSGSRKAMQLALDLVRPGGVINHISLSSYRDVPLIMDKVVFKELTLIGSLSHPGTVNIALDLALKLWKENKYALDKMVTHSFRLDDAELALRTAAYEIQEETPIKTTIAPNR